MDSSRFKDMDIDISSEKDILKNKKIKKVRPNSTRSRTRNQGLRRYRVGSGNNVNMRKTKISEKPLEEVDDKVTNMCFILNQW